MKIQALRVENWRSIRRLELNDLADGLNVLHGPNGTGKSSLVAAIRACLLDIDHDSSSAEIRSAVPHGTSDVPEVAVEFESSGNVYRITKRFSARKDGFALLERSTGFGWKTEIDESKEAGRRVRSILGTQSSAANWFGLLWLNQGEAELKPDAFADGDLRTSIINALGGLVTARDRAIEKALQAAARRWLTPTGKLRSKSALSELQKVKLPEAERRVQELREQRRRLDGSIAQVDGLRRRIDQLQQQIAEAEDRCAALAAKLRDFAPQEEKRAALERQLAAAVEKANSLSQRLNHWRELGQHTNDAKLLVEKAKAQLAAALKRHDTQQTEFEAAKKLHQRATTDLQALRDRRAQLEACKQRAQTEELRQDNAKLVSQRTTLEQELTSLESDKSDAPSEDELKRLAARWRELQTAEARLSATAVNMELVPDAPCDIRAEIDGTSTDFELSSQQDTKRSFQGSAELHLPGWGIIRLSRQVTADVEREPQRIADERQRLEESIAQYSESLANEDWLGRLSDRAMQRQARERNIGQLKRDLHKLERDLAAQEAALTQAEQFHHETPSDLHAEEGSEAPVKLDQIIAEVAEIDRELAAQENAVSTAMSEQSQAEQAWRSSEHDVHQLRRQLAVAENDLRHGRLQQEQFSIPGESREVVSAPESASTEALDTVESTLQAQLAAAQEQVNRLREQVSVLHQPADTQGLVEQESAAKVAREELRRQHQQAREELSEMRGRIAASEGTHTQLAEAEHTLEYLQGRVSREQTQVEAHRYLLQLFQECRQGDVAEMLEPVSKLVSRWAVDVGMAGISHVPISSEFRVPHVQVSHAGAEHQLDLAQESHGAVEQLSLLVRLAMGGILSVNEPRVMLLDDPLVHTDARRQEQMLAVMQAASGGNVSGEPASGPLQLMILTCHPERFASLADVRTIDLLTQGQFQSSPEKHPAQATENSDSAPNTVPRSRRRKKASQVKSAATVETGEKSINQRGFWD
ncbi:MAG: AAA family ATPase [Pirellulales bacterium]|nr:AAA family ATPase [Pirellulales bacterium]